MDRQARQNLEKAINEFSGVFKSLGDWQIPSAIATDMEKAGYLAGETDLSVVDKPGKECAEKIVKRYINDKLIKKITANDNSCKNLMSALKRLTDCLGIVNFNMREQQIDYADLMGLKALKNTFNPEAIIGIFKSQLLPQIHVFLENTAQKLDESLLHATAVKLGDDISTAIGHSFTLNIIKVNPKLADFKSTIAPLAGEHDLDKLAAAINDAVAAIDAVINSLSDDINALYEAAGGLETIQQDTFSRGRIFQNNSLPDIYDYLQQNIQHLGTPLLPNIKAKSGLALDRESDNILIIRVADADIAEAAAEPLGSLEAAENDLQKWVDGINALAAAINEKINHLSNGFKDLYEEFDKLKAAIPEPIRKASENEIEGVFDAFKSGTSQSLDGLVGLIEKFYAGD